MKIMGKRKISARYIMKNTHNTWITTIMEENVKERSGKEDPVVIN